MTIGDRPTYTITYSVDFEVERTLYIQLEGKADRPLWTTRFRVRYEPGWTDQDIRDNSYIDTITPPRLDPPAGTTIIQTFDTRDD